MTKIPASDLTPIVCGRSEGWEAARLCCGALRAMADSELSAAQIPIEDLRRIYRVRLMKPAIERDLPIGSDRLLADLEAHKGKTVQLLTFETGSHVYGVMLDEEGQALVTCFVGTDQRILP